MKLKYRLPPIRWFLQFKNPWNIVLRKIGAIRDPYPLHIRFDNRVFFVREDRKDRGVLDEFYDEDGYEDLNLDAYDFIIDVGAHIGVFTLEAAQHADRVFAFEPNPGTYSLLERNLSTNDVDNVDAYNVAVLAERGGAVIEEGGSSMTDAVQFIEHSPGDIKTVTLEFIVEEIGAAMQERKSLLKIDAEGSEFAIINSAPRRVLQKFDTVFLEWHGSKGEPEELVSRLASSGFSVAQREDPRRNHPGLGFIYATQDT